MRLVIITNYWINSPGGGVKEYTKNFAKSLEEIGFDVKIIFREGKDKKNYKMPHNKIKFVLASYKILIKLKPDTILTQGGWFTELPAIIYKIKNPKAKIIVLFHTQYDEKQTLLKRIIYDIIINLFDNIGFVSKALEKNVREIAKIKIKKDTFVLYAGAIQKKVSKKEIDWFRKKHNIPSDKIILLGQGLTAHKLKYEGAKLLIQAVKILKEKNYPVCLILTRDGKYSDLLKKYAFNINVEGDVIFTGDVNPYVALAVCDIYTHITLGDGLPLSLLEALAMGKPIVATAIGGIPEVIKDKYNGLLVEPIPEKITIAIEKLIRDENLRNYLAKNAKDTAKNNFTWRETAEHFKKIVEE